MRSNPLPISIWLGAALLGLTLFVFAPLAWVLGLPGTQKLDVRYVVDGRDVVYRTGDDPRWSQPDLEAGAWPTMSWSAANAQRCLGWLRFKIDNRELPWALPTGARITSARPFELYWDGKLLAANGVPGRTRNEERSGMLDFFFNVPPALLEPGVHQVAMRISGFHDLFPGGAPMYFKLDDPANLYAWKLSNALCPTGAAGIMAFLAIACGALWLLAFRRAALLWLSCLCVAGTVANVLELYRWLHGYPGSWHFFVTIAEWSASGWMMACFAGFVFAHFSFPSRRWWLAALIPVLAAAAHFAPRNQSAEVTWMALATFVVTLVPLVRAIGQRKPGAIAAIVGVIVSAICLLNPSLPFDFFPEFLPALTGIVVAVALAIRAEHREAQKAKLTAARLEIELLKKSLQPHFLMNTLTALAQTVEESPASAVKLIDDLAEEFRTLSAMSGEREVSLRRELELCRAHLRLMRARTEIDWELETECIDENWPIPPALFLTLIENGFSHQRVRDRSAKFMLRAEAEADRVRYTFHSPGEIKTDPERVSGGTGLRYIRARLNESFPGAWSLTERMVANGWETVIEMRRSQVSGAGA